MRRKLKVYNYTISLWGTGRNFDQLYTRRNVLVKANTVSEADQKLTNKFGKRLYDIVLECNPDNDFFNL